MDINLPVITLWANRAMSEADKTHKRWMLFCAGPDGFDAEMSGIDRISFVAIRRVRKYHLINCPSRYAIGYVLRPVKNNRGG